MEIKIRSHRQSRWSFTPAYADKLGQGRINDYKALTVTPEPHILFRNYSIDDSLGDDDGIAEPEETINLIITLKNDWADAIGITAVLSSSDPNVVLINNASGFDDIACGNTSDNSTNPYKFSISSLCPENCKIPFTLNIITADNEYTVMRTFELQVGGVSGHITDDTTWSGFIYISEDVTVDAGITLTISAGTTIEFSSEANLIIEGILYADGTKDNIINFPKSVNSKAGAILNFTYASLPGVSAGNSSFNLSHCAISGEVNGTMGSCIYIDHCAVQNSINNGGPLTVINSSINGGISLYYEGGLLVDNNVIIGDDSQNGVVAWPASGHSIHGTITNNVIKNFNKGVWGVFSTHLTIEHNIIANNNTGVELGSMSGGSTVYDNDIVNNFTGITCGYNKEDDISIDNNRILNNIKGIDTACADINNNLLLKNNDAVTLGLCKYPSDKLIIVNGNTIIDNITKGIVITGAKEGSPTITENSIYSNNQYNIFRTAVDSGNITATDNYWEATDPDIIDSRIWDDDEDPDVPLVEFIPISIFNPPVLNSIGNKVVTAKETLSFTVTAADPAGKPLNYSAFNLPEGANFDPGTQTFIWTPDSAQTGTHSNIIIAVSNGDLIDCEIISIMVITGENPNPINQPPLLQDIEDKSICAGDALEFVVNANDPDGDLLTYFIDNLRYGMSFNTQTGVFKWTPTENEVGTYSIFFAASDGKLIDTHLWILEVTNDSLFIHTCHQYNNSAEKYTAYAHFAVTGNTGNVTKYEWDFGDGTVDTYEGAVLDNGKYVTHRYLTYNWKDPGDENSYYEPFIVKLTVTYTDTSTEELTLEAMVYIAGDANGDGKVTVIDAAYVGKYWEIEAEVSPPDIVWKDSPQADKADLNNDGTPNLFDMAIVGATWGDTAY